MENTLAWFLLTVRLGDSLGKDNILNIYLSLKEEKRGAKEGC